jgi:hypothetical protein
MIVKLEAQNRVYEQDADLLFKGPKIIPVFFHPPNVMVYRVMLIHFCILSGSLAILPKIYCVLCSPSDKFCGSTE